MNWVKMFQLVIAELPQVGILFGTQFPSLGIFISDVWVTSGDPERNDILRLEDGEQGGV